MILDKLSGFNIILGSKSPRRHELLKSIGIVFTVKYTEKDENYPKQLNQKETSIFVAKQKAKFIAQNHLPDNYLLITADTTVSQNGAIIHKPKDQESAIRILEGLSGKEHQVITGVCIKSNQKQITFLSKTKVAFHTLSREEILYYTEKFKPFDKSGSYGIQEWIGYIGIKKINGSYNNVVGLPTAELYQKLKLFI